MCVCVFLNWLVNVSPFPLSSWHTAVCDLSRNVYECLTSVDLGNLHMSLLSLQDLTQAETSLNGVKPNFMGDLSISG